jgi:hypothetical protein
VNLPHSHQHRTTIFTTNTTQKPPPILRHQSRLILVRPPQIQRPRTRTTTRATAIDRRNPTQPRTKPMPQPPIPLPPRYLYDLYLTAANSVILSNQPTTPNKTETPDVFYSPDFIYSKSGPFPTRRHTSQAVTFSVR